jgi:hypothetical protein
LLYITAKASIALKIVIFLIFDDHVQISIVFIPDSEEESLSLKRLICFEPELNRIILNDFVYIKSFTAKAIRLLKTQFYLLIDAGGTIKVIRGRDPSHCWA